jgi:hypothetical protein
MAVTAFACLASFGMLPRAEACSICRCGDPTFNALGKEAYAARGFSAALDWERFDKDEGDPADESESQVENRYTALASYGVGERLTLFLRVPYSSRTLEENGGSGETVETSGFSDPELYGQVRLWGSRFSSGVGQRSSLSLNLGLKAPLGANDVEEDGARVDEHAQPGTGSTDVFGSLAVLHLIDRQSALFASAGYRRTGTNDFEYRYGSTFTANLAYEHKLGTRLDGVVELNFRRAAKDRGLLHADDPDEEPDHRVVEADDTGGALLYVTPRLLAQLGGGLVLRAAAQIPLARDLNGFQKERAVLNVGLTYLFAR